MGVVQTISLMLVLASMEGVVLYSLPGFSWDHWREIVE